MVLAQRSVDDVIIGAPDRITESLLDTYKIDIVVPSLETDNWKTVEDFDSAYSLAWERGILRNIEIESPLCKDLIIKRIVDN